MDNYLVGAVSMSKSEQRRENFIILVAKEDTVVVETSVTKTIHIYLLSAFFHGAPSPINCSDIRYENTCKFQYYDEIVYVLVLGVGLCSCVIHFL